MAQKSCSYSFTGPDGQRVVLRGQAAIKAWLVAGGLEYLRGATNDALASRERWSKPGGPAVVYDGPRRDGVSMLAGGYHPQQRVAWIEAVQVDGDRRRSGIGAGAVSDFEAWASSMGAVRIRAEATPSSLRFWEALGYKVVGQAFSNNRTPIEKDVARASRARDVAETPDITRSSERDLDGFRKGMLARIDTNIAMAKMRGAGHDWAFNVGDQLLSTKTGKVYTLVGRIFQRVGPLKNNDWQPVYYYEADGGNEKGTFPEKAILESKTLKSLTTPIQRSRERQTETAAFKRWFGDSKVVDADGKPLVVYHGTGADFSTFDGSMRGDRRRLLDKLQDVLSDWGIAPPRGRFKGNDLDGAIFGNRFAEFEKLYGGPLPPLDRLDVGGIFFTDNRRLASEYAVATNATTGGKKSSSAPNVIPAYIKLERPMVLEFELDSPVSVLQDDGSIRPIARGASSISMTMPDGTRHQIKERGIGNFWNEANRVAYAFAKKYGADGIIVKNVWDVPTVGKYNDAWSKGISEADVYIAFSPTQIKSAIGNSGTFDPTDPDITRSRERGIWYSQLARAIEGVPARLDNQSGILWAQWLKANAAKLGVKQDEITWSGIEDFLKLKGKAKVSTAEIGAYLAEGGVRVEEVVLGEVPMKWYFRAATGSGTFAIKGPYDTREIAERFASQEYEYVNDEWRKLNLEEAVYQRKPAGPRDLAAGTKYDQYTLPGGTNYREVLLTLPEPKLADIEPWTPGRMRAKRDVFIEAGFTPLGVDVAIAAATEAGGVEAALRSLDAKVGSGVYRESQKEARDILRSAVSGERKNKEKRLDALSKASYKSSHWDAKNVLAHIRLNDRADADGRRVLLVEELQSDFGSDTRKQRANIEKAVDEGFEAIVERMKKAGVLEVVCE